jgi:hypothetical protein
MKKNKSKQSKNIRKRKSLLQMTIKSSHGNYPASSILLKPLLKHSIFLNFSDSPNSKSNWNSAIVYSVWSTLSELQHSFSLSGPKRKWNWKLKMHVFSS